MIKLGEKQKLKIIKLTSVGAYLNDVDDEIGAILLPKSQLSDSNMVGDEIEVFVYKDSEDRYISTINNPKIKLGEIQNLKVIDITKIGAFLDWGLEKDLFMPYKEQVSKVKRGDECLVTLYIDKSDRLCATMKIYDKLSINSDYKKGDYVKGKVFKISSEYGIFVAIDCKYIGMIPREEVNRKFNIGEELNLRITEVRDDGKINLSVNRPVKEQMIDDSNVILEYLSNNNNFLDLNDKSKPDEIRQYFNMSKNAFKRGVGRLLKEGKIEFYKNGIKKANI